MSMHWVLRLRLRFVVQLRSYSYRIDFGNRFKMSKPPAVIPATEKHTASLIFLHGLDDVGATWHEEFQNFDIPKKLPYVKFIFPTASIMNISKNNGESMTSWFDVFAFDEKAREDHDGIVRASALMNSFVEEEIRQGIPAERIIIGGFSMGGAVALHTALTTTHVLGGIIALSTWLPLLSSFPQALVRVEKKFHVPVLQCHGDQDTIIPLDWSRRSEKLFQQVGFQRYAFKQYDGLVHTNSEPEMKDVTNFIEEVLPKIN